MRFSYIIALFFISFSLFASDLSNRYSLVLFTGSSFENAQKFVDKYFDKNDIVSVYKYKKYFIVTYGVFNSRDEALLAKLPQDVLKNKPYPRSLKSLSKFYSGFLYRFDNKITYDNYDEYLNSLDTVDINQNRWTIVLLTERTKSAAIDYVDKHLGTLDGVYIYQISKKQFLATYQKFENKTDALDEIEKLPYEFKKFQPFTTLVKKLREKSQKFIFKTKWLSVENSKQKIEVEDDNQIIKKPIGEDKSNDINISSDLLDTQDFNTTDEFDDTNDTRSKLDDLVIDDENETLDDNLSNVDINTSIDETNQNISDKQEYIDEQITPKTEASSTFSDIITFNVDDIEVKSVDIDNQSDKLAPPID